MSNYNRGVYKVLDIKNHKEVVILQKSWRENIHELRKLDHADLLVCPVCTQAVRVRAGKYRRWHFAHKHLANCPLATQSANLLSSRAVLYDWLVKLVDFSVVTVEKAIPGLPRPVDCWVMLEDTEIGYWIFDTRYSPIMRQQLLTNEMLSKKQMNWLYTINMLRIDEKMPGWLYLTTTERDFMRSSSLDSTAEAAGNKSGYSLHYLDHQKLILHSYRRLQLQHKPQRFSGRLIENPLSSVNLLPGTGEFLHPGESQLLDKYIHQMEAAQKRLKKHQELMSSYLDDQESRFSRSQTGKTGLSFSGIQDELKPDSSQRQPFVRQGTCIYCGKKTVDWLTYDARTGECICRDCQNQ